ncbi:PepSY-associated TM helix domain-containing protein [Flammeovirgaceae bacterium SG7u.111]|nr:PepSY-associated TM helix domain-containing protein [Flammeovirgaceae bacterium SG7u.132]WPO33051.1 PepSY-associated TM helix domain-containing protein [Flammeovirgaceae bacterium SG7u.111]
MNIGKRIYNILFHTHTVSGIVISVGLYVIFFAGSFSFFRDEIVNWERGHSFPVTDELDVNADTVIQNLGETYQLYGRDIGLRHIYNERRISVSLAVTKDSTAGEEAQSSAFFYMDTSDKSTATYRESYTLGEFLYRLHFFTQIPYPVGYYLSGFTAFFFLFAILTGIIVHWNKIISNFYVFRPWAKLKTLWTDSHTALGLIGFPFQFVYALTGAFFMLKAMVIAPVLFALYDGDQKKLYKDLEYDTPVYELHYKRLPTDVSINSFIDDTKDQWGGFRVTNVQIFNYGDANMHVALSGNIPYENKMNGVGKIIYKVADGSVVYEKDPLLASSYLDIVKNLLYRLHFADYANYGLRIISFVLGLISCYVILSGVMIWLVARDKKNIPEKQRRFNEKVVWWYLAICLSMYPMTALEFIVVKVFQNAGMTFIYQTFFIGWLVLSVFFYFKRSNVFTVKYSLILGSVFGFMIPIVNGIVSGNWLWVSLEKGLQQIWFIDIFWIVLSSLSTIAVFKYLPKRNRILFSIIL